jgi:putative inorganic carbon (hco3(-)) transporter
MLNPERGPSMSRRNPAGLSSEWWYFYAVLLLWVFIPEVRRLLDWQRGTFESVQLLSVVPLAAVIPLAIPFVRGGWRRMTLEMGGFTYLWLLAFTYALLVGAALVHVLSSVYAFLGFSVPVIAGLWVATQGPTPTDVAFRRIAIALLWMATLSSLYGIFQFVAPPPWDIFWLYHADIPSAGAPEPFSFRIFGTMNSQGPFADFLAIVLVMNLNRLRLRQPWALAAIVICVIALALTQVRSAWIALAAGLCLYLILSAERWRAIATLPVFVALIALPAVAMSNTFGDEHTTMPVADRINTLAHLQDDVSGNERYGLIDYAFQLTYARPSGEGLGVIGLGTKLSNERLLIEGFDNGYLARFIEMGYVAGLTYVLVVFGALALLLRRWSKVDPRDTGRRELFVLAGAAQMTLLALDLAADAHNAITGVLFWIVVGVALAADVHESSAYRAAVPQFRSTA